MKTIGKSFVVVLLIVLAAIWFSNWAIKKSYPIKYAEIVSKESAENNVPKNLILAVMREESHFNPSVVSSAKAEGLMQLMPATATWIATKKQIKYNSSTIQDPEVNIDLGVWYLRYLLNQFKNDDTLAIEAYNAGITNVIAWQKKNPNYIEFAETDNFVKRVKKSKTMYDNLYGENWER